MKHANVRETLIDRTITVLGTEGMDKATTKAIVTGTGMSEVYIYRHFANKEDLFIHAFEKLDEELAQKALTHIHVMYIQSMDYKERCRYFFNAVWEFLLQNQTKCMAYIRYYYSPYYNRHSIASHTERFAPVQQKFQDAFQEDADAQMLLNHIMTTILDFAVRVFEDQLPNDAKTAEHVFLVIYHAIYPYFKHAANARKGDTQ